MSLVLWIVEHCVGVRNPNGYVDDCFGVELASAVETYEPEKIKMPASQCRLLDLWDQLGIPHKPKKQVYGEVLMIIGIQVDANRMTLTLPEDRRKALLEELDHFIIPPGPGKRPKRIRLKEYQALAGWMNWSFNVYPLLRPSLSNLYAKLRSLVRLEDRVKMTKAILEDLKWAKGHLVNSDGIHIIQERDWSVEDADFIAYSDACLTGLGFYIPSDHQGYYGDVPPETPSK